eukprot:3171578-Rhodomonas_salina.2
MCGSDGGFCVRCQVPAGEGVRGVPRVHGESTCTDTTKVACFLPSFLSAFLLAAPRASPLRFRLSLSSRAAAIFAAHSASAPLPRCAHALCACVVRLSSAQAMSGIKSLTAAVEKLRPTPVPNYLYLPLHYLRPVRY